MPLSKIGGVSMTQDERTKKYGKDFGWIAHMIDHCENAVEDVSLCSDSAVFSNNRLIRKSVVMSLLSLGELIKDAPDEIQSSFSEDLLKIRSFRNRAAHSYHTINFDIVYGIVKNNIPLALSELEMLQNKS